MWRHLNREERFPHAKVGGAALSSDKALEKIAETIKGLAASEIGLLLSAQYTVEEYEALLGLFCGKLGVKSVFQWREPTEQIADFDGLLYRGDHNANTQGLMKVLRAYGVNAVPTNQFDEVPKAGLKFILALVPEIPSTFPSLKGQLKSLSELGTVSAWGLWHELDNLQFQSLVPLKGFAEKTGTFINYRGHEGKLEAKFPSPVNHAVDVSAAVAMLQKHIIKADR
jgi:NADH-quinone oxidoreductase subunit G